MDRIQHTNFRNRYRSFHATVWGEFFLTIILVVFLFPGSQFLYANPDSSPPQVVAGVSNMPGAHPQTGDPDPGQDKPNKPNKPAKSAKPNEPVNPDEPAKSEDTTPTDDPESPDGSPPSDEPDQPDEAPGDPPVVLPDQSGPVDVPFFRGNPQAGKKVALTFDDGPYAGWTAEYLKVLEDYQVPAVFFVVGTRVEQYPEIARKIVEHGFDLGSHSYRHAKLTLIKPEVLQEDFRKTEAALSVADQVKFFRPPYGAYNPLVTDTAKSFGLKTIGWNVDPRDWDTEDADKVVQRVLAQATDGSIILLHEGRKSTLAALPDIITGLQDKGFELVSVSELLK